MKKIIAVVFLLVSIPYLGFGSFFEVGSVVRTDQKERSIGILTTDVYSQEGVNSFADLVRRSPILYSDPERNFYIDDSGAAVVGEDIPAKALALLRPTSGDLIVNGRLFVMGEFYQPASMAQLQLLEKENVELKKSVSELKKAMLELKVSFQNLQRK